MPYTSISTDKVYFDSTSVSGKATSNSNISVKIGSKTNYNFKSSTVTVK